MVNTKRPVQVECRTPSVIPKRPRSKRASSGSNSAWHGMQHLFLTESKRLRGIHQRPTGDWAAQIRLPNVKSQHIGQYRTPQAAASAYDHAVVAYGLDPSRLNFPEEQINYDGSRSPNSVARFIREQIEQKYPNSIKTKTRKNYTGIHKHGNLWEARVDTGGGNTCSLGLYISAEHASRAYDDATAKFGLNPGLKDANKIKTFAQRALGCSSNYVGVYPRRYNWRAFISTPSEKWCYLGTYKSAEAAAWAHDAGLAASGQTDKNRNFPEAQFEEYSGGVSAKAIRDFARAQTICKYPEDVLVRLDLPKGVRRRWNEWHANIWSRGPDQKSYWLGSYSSIDAAAWAYDAAAVALELPADTRNFPEEEIVYSGSKSPDEIKKFVREFVYLRYPEDVGRRSIPTIRESNS